MSTQVSILPKSVKERIRDREQAAPAIGDGTLTVSIEKVLSDDNILLNHTYGGHPAGVSEPANLHYLYPRDRFDRYSRWITISFRGFLEKEETLLASGRLTPRVRAFDLIKKITKGKQTLDPGGVYLNHIVVTEAARRLGLYHLIQSAAIINAFSYGADMMAALLGPSDRWHDRWRPFGYEIKPAVPSEWTEGTETMLHPAVLDMRTVKSPKLALRTILDIGELLRSRRVSLDIEPELLMQCLLVNASKPRRIRPLKLKNLENVLGLWANLRQMRRTPVSV